MKQLAKISVSFVLLFLGSLFIARGNTTNAISFGAITNGSITGPAQTNFYTFTGTNNDLISAALLRTNGTGNPYLYLYGPLTNLVFQGGGSSLAYFAGLPLTNTGIFTFVVVENGLDGTYDYLLSLTKIACGVNKREAGDGAEAIVPGQITSGHISPADYDTFCFNATSNDVLYLTLLITNGPGTYPYFYLYDPDGILLPAPAYNDYVADIQNLRLTKTGTYTVGVIDNGLNEAFDYLITFNLAKCGTNQRESGDGPETLAPGQITSGHISPADYDTFCFNATSNDVLYLTLLITNGPGTYPYFYLYDPDGILLPIPAYNDYVADIQNLRLTKTGTYTVGVIDNGLNEAFDYLITFNLAKCGTNQRESGDGPETLAPGQITSGHISPADYDTFCFNATSNDVLYLTLLITNGPGTYPYFYLYDPDGILLPAPAYNDYVADIQNLRLTKTGTYTIGVIDNGLNEAFDYLITFNLAKCGTNQRESGDGPETLAPGQITSGHISPADYDTFCFNATSNDVLYLTLLITNGPGTYPYFYLYDPDGILLPIPAYNDYVADIQNLRLTKTGTYTIGVIDNGLNEAFDYLITFNLAKCGTNQRESGDGPETLAPGQITSGHISPADYDTFCFNATSNDVLYLTLLITNGPGTYPYFYLYDPDGILLPIPAYNDYVADIQNLRLTKTGTYTIGVIDNGLNEAFDYNLCMIKNPGPNFPDPGDGPYVIAPYETRSAQITPGDLDAFAFHAIAGDTLTIEVQKTSGTGLNPVVQLHAPDGTVLATASASTSAEISVSCVSQTGTYLIVIFDNGLNEAFGYTVSLGQTPIVRPSGGTIQYLAIYQCTNVIVRWETNSVGFILESTYTLPSTNWFPVTRVPQIIADHYYVNEGVVTNRSQFYRLRCTNCVSFSVE